MGNMSVEPKKKHKVLLLKKISREEITRVDDQTFYVPSSDPKKDPYFIFHSIGSESQDGKGWLCECENFIFNLKDKNDIPTHQCRHIKSVINEFFSEDKK